MEIVRLDVKNLHIHRKNKTEGIVIYFFFNTQVSLQWKQKRVRSLGLEKALEAKLKMQEQACSVL